MKQKTKPQVKLVNNQEEKNRKKFFLIMSFLFLFALIISLTVPVYYVPLFKNISTRYGLSTDIARKLTLLDLALNSFGIETPNMASVYRKQQIEYEPDMFYATRFNADGLNVGSSRLINAKETYYHEYERTRKRPAEIAGIYKDGTTAKVPEISGKLKGVRALPKGNFDDSSGLGGDEGFTDFTYKKATATTKNKEEVMGSSHRQVRGSFDRDDQTTQGAGEKITASKKPEPLPDFASSVYNKDGGEEVQTLENSRMIKPVVSGQEFSVTKPENMIDQLIGDGSFTDTFAALRNFGGYDGALGYYVKDDLPTLHLIDFFGSTGQDVFSSYFYSHAAVGRKYIESSKHLSEIAFNGDEPQDKVLIAKDQKQDKVPVAAENTDISVVFDFILTVKENMKECEDGRKAYEQTIQTLKPAYEGAKAALLAISSDSSNVAERGAPGSCNPYYDLFGNNLSAPTMNLRDAWNNNVRTAKEKCIAIRDAGEAYANACKMEYVLKDPDKDTCEAIDALEVGDGTDWWDIGEGICRRVVKWSKLELNPNISKSFHGCGGNVNFNSETAARNDCEEKQNNLFEEIDNNVALEAKPGFVFVD